MLIELILEQAVDQTDPKPPTSRFAGCWRNRLGSELDLAVENHEVTGRFRSGVGVWNPPADFHVHGFVEGDAIAFCVDFGRRGSVASWSGHLLTDDDGDRLVTLWHLAQSVAHPESESDIWNSMMAGSNEFTRND